MRATYENELARADELLISLGRRSAKERIAHLMRVSAGAVATRTATSSCRSTNAIWPMRWV
jgi:hypothetical protein